MAAVIQTMTHASSSTTPEVSGRSLPLFRLLDLNRFVGEEEVTRRGVDDARHIIVAWVSEGACGLKKLLGSPWWVKGKMQIIESGGGSGVDEALWFRINHIHQGWH
jgi:hypothetical protein